MKTETKLLAVILLVTLVLIFGAIFFLSKSSKQQGLKENAISQIDYSKGQKIGSDSAKVKVVEFSDFQCPACLSAEPFVKKVRLDNDVQLIYRHFPLKQHTYSTKTAWLSEAAGEEGKFWQMHDRLFETQTQWSGLQDADANSFFLSLAREIGLNEEKVKEALNGGLKAKVSEDEAEGLRLRVNATPTFFVQGHKLDLQSFADLVTVVEEAKK